MKQKILIIEDEAGFRRVYRDFLESQGYVVSEAADGEAGWQAAQADRPDLILLDVVMPKMNGFDVLKRIREHPRLSVVPVIILSVLGEPGDMDKGISLGADDYIVKGNVSTPQILKKIKASLPTPARTR